MSPELDEAVRRLSAAVTTLEGAAESRAAERRPDLETELQLMQDNRARLALELESAIARLGRVESATDHVGRRVQTAIGTLREVLDPGRGQEG